MFRNYFKVALRNLYRYKGFSLINILSLAIAVTGCLLIGLFVWDEMQYDKFVKDGSNIYRIYNKRTSTTGTSASSNTPPIFAPYIQQNYPGIVETTRLLMWPGKMLMESGEKQGYEEKGIIADSTFFSMFPLRFKAGDAKTALQGIRSVVLTEALSKKYFGDANPVGKTIKLDKTDFAVTGVLEKVPEHFHLDPGYIMPMSSAELPAERMQRWTWQQFFTYIKVKEGTNVDQLQQKFQQAVTKEAHPQTKDAGNCRLPGS